MMTFDKPREAYFVATREGGCGHAHKTEESAMLCAIRVNARTDKAVKVYKRTVEQVFPRVGKE